jgi:release factor glutamine methyltransferase
MAPSSEHLITPATIENIIHTACAQLKASSDTAKLDVELLLAHAINKDRTYLYTWNDKVVGESEVAVFNDLLVRRLTGEPIAYILGRQEFWNLDLHTDEHTLIPRADTETLIEWALELAGDLPTEARIIDLGTGTGASALALAKENKRWQVEAVDVMPKAVALAQKNAVTNNLQRVKFYQSSWFDNVNGCFDLIVSNPPYIDPEDEHLSQGDVRFEPKSALVADNKGLADLAIIADQSRQYLVNSGWLLMEHGYDQLDSVQTLLTDMGYQNVTTRFDLGGNPRITGGQFFHE